MMNVLIIGFDEDVVEEAVNDINIYYPEWTISKQIVGLNTHFQIDDQFDLVVTAAIDKESEYYNYISSGCKLKIYRDWRTLHKIPFKRFAFEISGICNAKCKYCPTGIKNREGDSFNSNSFVTLDDFVEVIEYSLANGIISKETFIDLFNWGEPFLNPVVSQITGYLSNKGFLFGLSTNVSIYSPLSVESVKGLSTLLFSMPGFSQESYDRIHGFSFKKICENIEKYVSNIRLNCSKKVNIRIAFHVYQFNLNEISSAACFAKKLGVDFFPYFAFPAAIDLTIGYLKKVLPNDVIYDMSKDLELFYVSELINKKPCNYYCNQVNLLSIDETCNLILGSCVSKHSQLCAGDFRLGKITEMSLNELKTKKRMTMESCHVCNECKLSKADYWGSNGGGALKRWWNNTGLIDYE